MATETIISIVLGIAGIICTYFIAKWQMKKNKIAHFTINSYDIGKGLRDEFSDFELHYGGKLLSKNVSVLKGGFMNIGRNDIGNSEFTQKLPNDCIVRAIKLYPSSDELDITYEICDKEMNSIVFHINDIFVSDEFFKYTVIVETPETLRNVENNLIFQHRILNTEKIKNVYIGQSNNLSVIPSLIATGVGIISSIFVAFSLLTIDDFRMPVFVIMGVMLLVVMAVCLFKLFWSPERHINRVLNKQKNSNF